MKKEKLKEEMMEKMRDIEYKINDIFDNIKEIQDFFKLDEKKKFDLKNEMIAYWNKSLNYQIGIAKNSIKRIELAIESNSKKVPLKETTLLWEREMKHPEDEIKSFKKWIKEKELLKSIIDLLKESENND